MNKRSKRQPKPTSKFLSFIKNESNLISSGKVNNKNASSKIVRSKCADATISNDVLKPHKKAVLKVVCDDIAKCDDLLQNYKVSQFQNDSPKRSHKKDVAEVNGFAPSTKKIKIDLNSSAERKSFSNPNLNQSSPKDSTNGKSTILGIRGKNKYIPIGRKKNNFKSIDVDSNIKESKSLANKSPDGDMDELKDTLNQFLTVGSKVASVISDTLKNDDEVLTSKFTSFEKSCSAILTSLLEQGNDVSSSHLESVLKMLNEHENERKVYRDAFLESLRASHQSNMTLYSQMLKILKSF